MKKKGEWHLVRAMRNDGASISDIARNYGIDRKTVRKMLGSESWPEDENRPRVSRPSKLDPYKDYIKARLEKVSLSAVRIYEEIKKQGYTGRLSILRDFLHETKEEKRLLAVVRFETLPGEQSQVDWTYIGKYLFDGRLLPVYAFVMVLGYSRSRFVTFTHSMDIQSLMRCHIEAFRYFGGHTRQILYDNMKTVILRPRSVDTVPVINPQFLDFAGFYGFGVESCFPYRPQTKGKVERLAGYVKDNFIKGREFVSLPDMKHQGLLWCDEVNGKVHGTTGRVPLEDLSVEGLIPPAQRDYDTSRRSVRIISRDCFFSYGGSRYEAPYRFVGKKVVVKDDDDGKLLVYSGSELIVEHSKACSSKETVRIPGLNKQLWEKVLGRERTRENAGEVATEPAKLVLVGREIPVVSVESRDLSYYEEAAG